MSRFADRRKNHQRILAGTSQTLPELHSGPCSSRSSGSGRVKSERGDMADVLMVAYTNYRRDPRVKREAEAVVEAGHRVVFLARRQPGEPNRETIGGVDVIKTLALKSKCTTFTEYMIDYLLFFAMVNLHLLLHPLRYRLIHVSNMPDFLVLAAWLPRLLGMLN